LQLADETSFTILPGERKRSFTTLEKQDGFMIDNEDIGGDIDLLTDQVRPLHDSPLTTVA
jgi:hypothetical protein